MLVEQVLTGCVLLASQLFCRQCNSVDGVLDQYIIERLQNIDSNPNVVAHHFVLGERHLMLFLTLGTRSLPIVVAQPDERQANRTASVLE